MKEYTKTYLTFFGYSVADFIPCELCGKKAIDIHHIYARSKRMDLVNDIINLMGLCREDHVAFGDKKQYTEFLKQKHLEFIESKGLTI